MARSMVTRYVLEQSRRNGDDLAAVRMRLDRVESELQEVKADVRFMRQDLTSLRKDLPSIITDSMCEVWKEVGMA